MQHHPTACSTGVHHTIHTPGHLVHLLLLALQGVVDAIRLLGERVGSTATFVQAALGTILRDTPPEYHEGNNQALSVSSHVKVLHVIK